MGRRNEHFLRHDRRAGSNASPQWEVERDVTEYAPIFSQASDGQASVYNIVNSQYTGIIYGTAKLYFYPATKKYQGRERRGRGLSALGRRGRRLRLSRWSEQSDDRDFHVSDQRRSGLSGRLPGIAGRATSSGIRASPTISQSNSTTAATPPSAKVKLRSTASLPASCRSIHGFTPAESIRISGFRSPGVETLNFTPYRIDLTPFAAQLDDGNQHTIAVSVFNDDNYFSANAALLVYEDHGSSVVTGKLVSNGTGDAPAQNVVENVKTDASGGARELLPSPPHIR